jgi:hypothetical protein
MHCWDTIHFAVVLTVRLTQPFLHTRQWLPEQSTTNHLLTLAPFTICRQQLLAQKRARSVGQDKAQQAASHPPKRSAAIASAAATAAALGQPSDDLDAESEEERDDDNEDDDEQGYVGRVGAGLGAEAVTCEMGSVCMT